MTAGVKVGRHVGAAFLQQLAQTLRLRVRAADTHEGKYSAQDYKSFDIAPRSGTPVVHAYAAAGSLAARGLEEITADGGWSHVILTMRWEAGSDASGPAAVVIDQVQVPALPGEKASPKESSAEIIKENSNDSGSKAVKSKDAGSSHP